MKDILKEIGTMFIVLGSTVIRIIGALFQVVSWATGKVHDLLNSLSTAMINRNERKLARSDY